MSAKFILAAAALSGAMATAALAEVDQIKSIDVTADLSAIEDQTAATYWGTLETDLEAAIASRVSERIAGAGADVIIDIREVELASVFARAMNAGDAVLVGQVNIVDQTDNANFDAYELSVTLGMTRIISEEGQTFAFSPDDTANYRLLVDTFADEVVKRLN